MDHNWLVKRDGDGLPVAKGRVCIDPTHVESGDPINSELLATEWAKMYGPVPYTDITTIIGATLQYADQNGYPLSEGRMWKDDVSNAVSLMLFDTESIRRAAILIHAPPEVCSATNLPPVFCILLRSCFFGWGGASFAFGVFTRALRQIIPSHMYGIFDMFVDDLMGFAHHSVVARGQQTAQYTETIRPSNRGCRKLLWAFFLVPQAAHQERPSIATGILPGAALIFSLPLLYSTARHVYVCSTFESTNCRHLRRPENHHIQCMVLH